MAALLILGGTLSTAALSDQRQAIRQQKNNEAYYIARSGAEAVGAVLLANQENMSEYIGKTTESELGSGRYFIEVLQENDGELILIRSTGYSGKYSETMTLTLLKSTENESEGSGAYFPIFDMGVFSNGPIELAGSGKVIGNAGTNSTETGAVNFDWDTSVGHIYIGVGGDTGNVIKIPDWSQQTHYLGASNLEQERIYPVPVFPEFPKGLPQYNDIIGKGDKKDYLINEPGKYDKISIEGSCKLTIDVGSENLELRVKKFTVKGDGVVDIKSSGNGRLILYVDELFEPQAYFNEDGKPGNLVIYYAGTTEGLEFSDNKKLRAHFFALKANLTIGGSGGLVGNAITLGDMVTITGGSKSIVQAVYAPNAHVEVTGGGGLIGAIVCDSIKISGGATVEYSEEIENIWMEVPELGYEFGDGSGENSGPEGGSGGCMSYYSRGYWSE
jgi:hypothetical protein